MTFPRPAHVRGRVRLQPTARPQWTLTLDDAGRHHWSPLAPVARVAVELDKPRTSWSGEGYLDTNWGEEPLESGFSGWHWARGSTDQGTTVLYDTTPRSGAPLYTALTFDATGGVSEATPPPPQPLSTALWGIKRRIPAAEGVTPRVLETLEDTPFYARSLVTTRVDGAELKAVHESLNLDRFSRRWVQMLLPFRMPRRRTPGA